MAKLLKYILLTAGINFIFSACVYAQSKQEKRQGYLEELVSLQERPEYADSYVSYHDSTWLAWVKRTGSLPPDFAAMPSIPSLPDPLIIDEGGKDIPVKTASQWKKKRKWIEQKVKHIISGTFPAPPEKLTAKVLEEQEENGVKIQKIELRFREEDEAKLTLKLFIPPGEGPFPVFMSQWNHRGWAQIAVRRGYMGVIYAGADAKDDTKAYMPLYPEHDWSTLMRRAWGAHRAVDYLYTLDSVDTTKIALTGHSRNGKQSVLAAAFDNRIDAVISSSGGTGGELPYRYTDETYDNESIEFLLARRTHWFHPRLRYYWGREHKLPIDQNSLLSLIAPNSLLLSYSIRESFADPWAIEEMYHSLSKVYSFLDAPEKLGIRPRDGKHGTSARDIEAYLDWLDIQFGRKDMTWNNKLYWDYSFEKWKDRSGETVDPDRFQAVSTDKSLLSNDKDEKIHTVDGWKQKRDTLQSEIRWMLGEKPAGIPPPTIERLSYKEDYISSFIDRPQVENGERRMIAPYSSVGDYLYGSLYYPTNSKGEIDLPEDGKMPVVIYLHKFSNVGFDEGLSSLFDDLLSRGIAVFAMDLIGFGTRIEEGTNFYKRYPHWSKFGKMVTDTRAAIEAMEDLEFIDNEKIFLSGYALGGTVSLFTAAMDDRIAGTAVSSAFTPLRYASSDVEGVKKYSHLLGLLPRLGFFIGHEEKIPVDFPGIMASIAPRPLMVIAPDLDRHADSENVRRSMEKVESVYRLLNTPENLQFNTPHGFNNFTSSQKENLVKWLDERTKE